MNESTEGAAQIGGTIRLEIRPRSDYYAENDERSRAEAFELQEAIQRELPDVVESRPAEDEKGIITDVVIPLASSGALSATVEVFKAWLGKRPTNRTIDVDFEVEQGAGQKRTGQLHIDSTNVDNEVLNTISKEVFASGK